MFESIYIIDAGFGLTFEYLVFPHAPTYSEVGATVSSKLRDSSISNQQFERIPLNQNYFVCAYSTSMIIVCLLCLNCDKENETNPLFPSVFLEKLILAGEDYFGSPLVPTKLLANSDTLTLLINEMIVNGMPHITEVNNLKDLILQKSLLSTILRTGNQLASAAANKSLSSLSTGNIGAGAEESEVPWRKSKVSYIKNEMFVDVVESVNALLRPTRKRNKLKLLSGSNFDLAFYSTSSLSSTTNLALVSRTITGNIDFVSHLSGVPRLQILLNSAVASMEAVLLHKCIDFGVWRNSQALSFIPPDRNSTLLSYTIDLDKIPNDRGNMLGLLEFDFETGLGLHKNEFEFRIHSLKTQAVSKIEHIKVEVLAFKPLAPESYDDDDEFTSRRDDNQTNAVSDIKVTRITEGDFLYKGNGVGEWTIKNLQAGDNCVLQAGIRLSNFSANDSSIAISKEDLIDITMSAKNNTRPPVMPTQFLVSYLYKGLVPSGLKVDSLKLVSIKGMSEAVKPYKGVKYITKTGNYTVRTS